MKRGSLIIYDEKGVIWYNSGDAQGDILPHVLPVGIPYILTNFGELENKLIIGVDVKSKTLILKDNPKLETKEEKLLKENDNLQKSLLDTQEQLINSEYKKLIGGIN